MEFPTELIENICLVTIPALLVFLQSRMSENEQSKRQEKQMKSQQELQASLALFDLHRDVANAHIRASEGQSDMLQGVLEYANRLDEQGNAAAIKLDNLHRHIETLKEDLAEIVAYLQINGKDTSASYLRAKEMCFRLEAAEMPTDPSSLREMAPLLTQAIQEFHRISGYKLEVSLINILKPFLPDNTN